MCGICGFTGVPNQGLLQSMTDALRHRGPDAEGFYTNEGINLGVRRLRIIDLVSGDQPLHNEDSKLWVVFNGEIYNYRQLTESLKAKGHRFYTQSDTEVIVHIYEEYGKDCLEQLEGMFCFAIWDVNQKELFIARDRLGIKPLYYYFHNGVFRFASELKSLLQDNSIKRELELESLVHFFTYLCTPSDSAIFKNIKKLPPACALTFKDGNIHIQTYWDLRFNPKLSLNKKDLRESVIYHLQEAVKKRLISDVPLGIFLSGGIDSSSIVALTRNVSNEEIMTFSIGYGKKDSSFNELDYVGIISKTFNTRHYSFIVEPDIIELLPKVVWHLDEPFADASAILNYLISQQASQHITVALAGIGGDEMFGGYPRYLAALFSSVYCCLPHSFKNMLAYSSRWLKESLDSQNAAGRIKRFLQAGPLGPEERYIYWTQFFNAARLRLLFEESLIENIPGFDPLKIHKQYYGKSDAVDYLDKIMYMDVKTYLCDDLLFLGDRMSMANSLEVRVPFCDHKLVEFCASLSYCDRFEGFRLKGLLRSSLAGILPAEILNRRKQGFMAPVARWIKEDLQPYIREVLSDEQIKKLPFLRHSYVKQIIEEHFSGRANNANQIWSILVLKLWLDVYVRASA